MAYEVEFTDEFREWFEANLSAKEQDSVAFAVDMLETAGPLLKFPYGSGIGGSRFTPMRELRIQHEGRP